MNFKYSTRSEKRFWSLLCLRYVTVTFLKLRFNKKYIYKNRNSTFNSGNEHTMCILSIIEQRTCMVRNKNELCWWLEWDIGCVPQYLTLFFFRLSNLNGGCYCCFIYWFTQQDTGGIEVGNKRKGLYVAHMDKGVDGPIFSISDKTRFEPLYAIIHNIEGNG